MRLRCVGCGADYEIATSHDVQFWEWWDYCVAKIEGKGYTLRELQKLDKETLVKKRWELVSWADENPDRAEEAILNFKIDMLTALIGDDFWTLTERLE